MLSVQGLCFAYPGQAPLFNGWRATLPAGLAWLAGDTGSGKTTLLRLLAADLAPASGQCTLGGVALAADGATWRERVCWFDPRNPAWDSLTPAGLRAAQQALHPVQRPAQHPTQRPALRPAQRRAQSLSAWQRHLQGFGLLPHLDKPLYALSTGSRCKAALAVALSSGAPLILLDEPSAGLDAASLRHLALALGEADALRASVLVLASSQGRDAVPGAPHGHLLTLPDRSTSG